MRELALAIVITLICSAPARADPPKVAVFDFEMFETRLQGEYLRDAHGNTDESWSRAASSLLRNRLLAPDDGARSRNKRRG
jgi:hypothetical protein